MTRSYNVLSLHSSSQVSASYINPYYPEIGGGAPKKKISKVDLTARNGSEIKLKTELDESLGQAMQERKEIAGMQLLEIPFSGMHRLPQWRTSELL